MPVLVCKSGSAHGDLDTIVRRKTMAWTCYSCGTKNKNSAEECTNCGGTVAAPSSFYAHWIFGGAFVFFLAYIIGVFLGGTLVEVAVAPSDAEVLAVAKANGATVNTVLELKPDESKAAKAVVVEKGKAAMSPVLKNLLYWVLPFLLFIVCGGIVGFISDGKTILEAAIGSLVGQVIGFLVLKYGLGNAIGLIPLVVGLIVGFGLAMLGAWLGENYQDRKERAVG